MADREAERRETLNYFADGVEKLDEEIAGLRAALAEAQRLVAELTADNAHLSAVHQRAERARADLAAEAQRREELMRPVVEAVRPMIAHWRQQGYRPDSYWATDDSHALVAVWDTYETQTGGTE